MNSIHSGKRWKSSTRGRPGTSIAGLCPNARRKRCSIWRARVWSLFWPWRHGRSRCIHRSRCARFGCDFVGLAIARWHEGRIFFGTPDPRQQLTADSRPQLTKLVNELETYRHPLASDMRQPLYRMQAERWLEAMVREDVTRIDASLDSRFVYAQVFANSGGEHGIFDLLTVTRSGRLAVLELKASEHIHLPLQAADYWLRVRRHLEQG